MDFIKSTRFHEIPRISRNPADFERPIARNGNAYVYGHFASRECRWWNSIYLNRYCFVYCQYLRYYCNCCSFMYCRINKLKKWLFYIYLLTTITKALYQPSEKGMSLFFTCPQLTEESSLAAARTWLLTTAHVM